MHTAFTAHCPAAGKHTVFVTGGVRSGKSRFARQLVERWSGPLLYLATAEVWDGEMAARVQRHRRDRGPRWSTLEEPLELGTALQGCAGRGGVLLDCLTLWASNLLGTHGEGEADDHIAAAVAAFWQALEHVPGRLCVVSNEVGSDVVPDNRLARSFRDLVGQLNQGTAARADQVYLMAAGLPVRLK